MKPYAFTMILFATPAVGTEFMIPKTMGTAQTFDTPLAVAEHVIDEIGTNEYDKINSSYFPTKITVKADKSYKECMFFAVKLIATMEYTTVSSADIARIKQKAFDSLCIIKNPDIQNRDWYHLIFDECMTTDDIRYRHFSAEKYQELESIDKAHSDLLRQQFNDMANGMSLTDANNKYSESIDILEAEFEQAKQNFFITNTSKIYSDNNKKLWCDCVVSAIFPYIDSHDDLNKFPSSAKRHAQLQSDDMQWNIKAHQCYTKLTEIYNTYTIQ